MNKMFNFIFLFISVFSLSLLITSVFLAKNVQQIIQNDAEMQSTVITEKYSYRISVFKGKLAVYESNSKIPYKVYNTYIDSLPYSDQEILKRGIYLNSLSEVKKIIEEYTS